MNRTHLQRIRTCFRPFMLATMLCPAWAMGAQLGPLQISSAQKQPFNGELSILSESDQDGVISLEVLAMECAAAREETPCPTVSVVEAAAKDNPAAKRWTRRLVSAAPVDVASFNLRLRLVSATRTQVRNYAVFLDSAPAPAPTSTALVASPPDSPAARDASAAASGQSSLGAVDTPAIWIPGNVEVGKNVLPQDILQMLKKWVTAWEQKKFAVYFACYSSHFKPAHQGTWEDWAAERRRIMTAAEDLTVRLKEPSMVQQTDGWAIVEFTQHYRSTSFSSVVRKRLMLQREDGFWMIQAEEVLADNTSRAGTSPS